MALQSEAGHAELVSPTYQYQQHCQLSSRGVNRSSAEALRVLQITSEEDFAGALSAAHVVVR